MALTQPKILWIICICDFLAIGVFVCALIFPWYHQGGKPKAMLHPNEPLDMGIFDAVAWKGNGMYVLGCLAAMIGGICLGLTSICIHFFGDACISKVGMDWFASFIKGMMLRVCNTAVMSCAIVGLFFGFQTREKGDTMGLGWYMNLIALPFGLVATVLIYYYPFAPSGEKGMFDDDEEGSEDEEGGYGGGDDDDDDDDDDEEGGKKKKGGGWGDWGFGGGGSKESGDDDSGSGGSEEEAPLKGKKKK